MAITNLFNRTLVVAPLFVQPSFLCVYILGLSVVFVVVVVVVVVALVVWGFRISLY